MNLDAEVTAAEIESYLPGVSIERIIGWRRAGKIAVVGYRATGRRRSPLYRWGDILRVEAETRRSPYNLRSPRRHAAA